LAKIKGVDKELQEYSVQ